MKSTAFAAFALLLAGGSIPVHAGYTFFTNRVAWETAVVTFATETFNSVPVGRLNAGTTQVGLIQFAHPGPMALGNLPEVNNTAPVNGTRAITAAVGIDGNPMFGNLPEYNDFILPYNATAFGANWESASSAGQLILHVAGQSDIDLRTYLPGAGTGFFGFIADRPFDRVRATVRSTSVANPGEIYSIDNVKFNQAPVPEPAAYVVLSAGLGLVLGRRRLGSTLRNLFQRG